MHWTAHCCQSPSANGCCKRHDTSRGTAPTYTSGNVGFSPLNQCSIAEQTITRHVKLLLYSYLQWNTWRNPTEIILLLQGYGQNMCEWLLVLAFPHVLWDALTTYNQLGLLHQVIRMNKVSSHTKIKSQSCYLNGTIKISFSATSSVTSTSVVLFAKPTEKICVQTYNDTLPPPL